MNTGDDSSCTDWPDYPPFRQALWASYLFGFDAFGFTNPQYSASGNGANRLCPITSLPTHIGTRHLTLPSGPVTTSVPTYWRLTNEGTIYVFDGVNTTCDGTFVRPSLDIAKQADPHSVQDGAPLTFTLRVTNTSMVTLTAMITDTLPGHIAPGETSDGTRIPPGDKITWTPLITAPSGVWAYTFVVSTEVGYTGTLVNRAEVTSQEGARGSRARSTVCVNGCRVYLPVIMLQYCLVRPYETVNW